MSGLTVWASSPLGPLTETSPGLRSTLTPSGIVMGLLPIRLMGSPYVGDDLAANALPPCLVPGQDPRGGAEDRGTHPAHHARNLAAGDVAPPARAGDPLEAGD